MELFIGLSPFALHRFRQVRFLRLWRLCLFLLSTPNSDDLCWFHGPAGFNDLLNMVVNPGEFLEFLENDQAGAPSATSISRLKRRWPGNATG